MLTLPAFAAVSVAAGASGAACGVGGSVAATAATVATTTCRLQQGSRRRAPPPAPARMPACHFTLVGAPLQGARHWGGTSSAPPAPAARSTVAQTAAGGPSRPPPGASAVGGGGGGSGGWLPRWQRSSTTTAAAANTAIPDSILASRVPSVSSRRSVAGSRNFPSDSDHLGRYEFINSRGSGGGVGDGDGSGVQWWANNTKLMNAAHRGGGVAVTALLRDMVAAGTAFPQNYSQAVKLLVADGDTEGGLAVAEEVGAMGLASISTYRPLMKYCGYKGDADLALATMDAMHRANVVADMYIYAELMNSLVRARRMGDAERVLRYIIEEGRKPHVVLFNTLLSGYSREANVSRTMTLFSQIREVGLEPNQMTFNIALDCCARAKDFKALEKTVEMMRLANVRPGAPTYNTLLKTLSRTNRFDEAVAMFAEMKLTIPPTRVTYNTMIDACAHRGDMETASAYFDEMMSVGFHPDVITFTSLIKGFGRSNGAARAVELFDAIREGDYALEDRTYYATINACLCCGDRANARSILVQMLDVGFFVRLRTWMWLLECDIWADDEAAAIELLSKMTAAQVPLDSYHRTRLLRECQKRGDFISFHKTR